jgi:hypothetical protein
MVTKKNKIDLSEHLFTVMEILGLKPKKAENKQKPLKTPNFDIIAEIRAKAPSFLLPVNKDYFEEHINRKHGYNIVLYHQGA